MSNLNRPDPSKMQAVLKLAASKLGTTPEELDAHIRDGTLTGALGNMKGSDAERLRAALSDPKTAERILSTPQAKSLYEKLTKGKPKK